METPDQNSRSQDFFLNGLNGQSQSMRGAIPARIAFVAVSWPASFAMSLATFFILSLSVERANATMMDCSALFEVGPNSELIEMKSAVVVFVDAKGNPAYVEARRYGEPILKFKVAPRSNRPKGPIYTAGKDVNFSNEATEFQRDFLPPRELPGSGIVIEKYGEDPPTTRPIWFGRNETAPETETELSAASEPVTAAQILSHESQKAKSMSKKQKKRFDRQQARNALEQDQGGSEN